MKKIRTLNQPFSNFSRKPFLLSLNLTVFVLTVLMGFGFWRYMHLTLYDFIVFVVGYQAITAVYSPFFYYFFSKLIKNQWTVARFIMLCTALTAAIWIFNSIFCYFFTNYDNSSLLKTFANLFVSTSLIGIVATFVCYFVITQKRLTSDLQKTEEQNSKLTFRVLKEDDSNRELITLSGNSRKDSLSLFPQELLYIESKGNYVHIYHVVNGKVLQKSFIATLSKMEETLKAYYFLVRCHRAFIVNLYRIEKITGFRIQLDYLTGEIPISRNYKAEVKKRIGAIGHLSKI